MTDNACTYGKNRSLRELLTAREIRHLTTQPYRPRTNGKVERFHQTVGREWAHGRSYPTSQHRANLLAGQGAAEVAAGGASALARREAQMRFRWGSAHSWSSRGCRGWP